MPIHNGTEWKSEKAWWVKVGGEWKKSTTIWKKVAGVWEKMTLSVVGLVSTFAGSGTYGASDGIGVSAEFSSPSGICSDGTYIYTSGFGNKIRRINPNTSEVFTFAGSGATGRADGIGTLAEFANPVGLCFLGGFIYVADSYGNSIRRIDVSTAEVTTFAGGGANGDTDGIGVLAEFTEPNDICTDGIDLYVADTYGDKIRKIEVATATVSTVAGSGTSGSSDGVGVLAEFDLPHGIEYYGEHLYISDTDNKKIRRIDISTAEVTTFAGSGASGSSDGVGVLAEFNFNLGIRYYGGYLNLCDGGNNKVRRIDVSTAEVTTLAGSGANGSTDGVGVLAEFEQPWGAEVHGGYLYITDSADNKVRRIYIGI